MVNSLSSISLQDPTIFNGTIRMNLDPFDDQTDEKIWDVLKELILSPFVLSFPEGLYHVLFEGGSNLSIGQKQMICLARALLKNSKILILDEVNALIDTETDRFIQVMRQISERTFFITLFYSKP